MKLIRELLPFLSIAGLFILTGTILVIITDKIQLHLSANAMVGGDADAFFAYYTHVGDGITVAIAVLLFSLVKYKRFLPYFSLGILTFAISGLLSQFFKRVIFSDVARPSKAIGSEYLNLVDGVDLHGSFSFPSGHSTVSFALFIFIAFVFRKYRSIQAIAAIMAILAAYSRVHLSQHFIEDIIAGAFLGISTFYIIFWVLNRFVFRNKLLD